MIINILISIIIIFSIIELSIKKEHTEYKSIKIVNSIIFCLYT